MPELFRMYGFLFMFFSHEHEPMHIHVIGNEGEAKFSWDGDKFVLEKSRNVKRNDLRRIKSVNQAILISSSKDGKNCSVRRMDRIVNIWFEEEWLYGHGDDGKTYRQSLLWYKALMKASQEERQKYTFSREGIHWRNLDTDVSFESFEYPEAEPTDLQRFFLTHPEINIAGFAERADINATLMRNYINGFKNPSPETVSKIKACLQAIGHEYLDAIL